MLTRSAPSAAPPTVVRGCASSTKVAFFPRSQQPHRKIQYFGTSQLAEFGSHHTAVCVECLGQKPHIQGHSGPNGVIVGSFRSAPGTVMQGLVWCAFAARGPSCRSHCSPKAPNQKLPLQQRSSLTSITSKLDQRTRRSGKRMKLGLYLWPRCISPTGAVRRFGPWTEEKVLKDGYATYLPPDCALEEMCQLFSALRSCHRQVQTTTTGPGLSFF